ncbi:MAG: OmpH family outer membrane protein [Flavobacteriia bacterium]|nr:OmpH family outer membrane protein [Flavobacteriia bacterium]
MKKTILFIALMFSALSASAQMKLAHVNSQQLLDTMPSRKDALEKLRKFEQDGYLELQEIQKDLESAYKRYEQNKGAMSPVILKIEEEKIMKKQQGLEDRQTALQQELQIYNQELNKPILARVQKAVEIVSDRKKINYVLDESSTLYFKGGMDITAEVLVELLILDVAAMKK